MRVTPCIFFSVLVLSLSGCALFSPQAFSPIERDYPADLTPAEILEILEERQESPGHLWARGGISLSGPQWKGKKFFQATLLYEAPDRLRLRGSRMITSTLFEFIIHAEKIALVWNRERKWFQGTRDQMKEHPEATFGMDPLSLPQALLIQQEFVRLLRQGRFETWSQGKDHYVFVTKDGERKAFLLRKKDLLIREAALYSREGRQSLKLKYLGYGLTGREILPAKLVASFPETGMTARIEIKEYKLPESFNASVFDLTPPAGFESHPLAELLEPPSL